MKIGVLGTGEVGGGIGRKLAALGHDVMLGSREPKKRARDFAGIKGLSLGTHAEASGHGEWVVNALPGDDAIETLRGCAIDGKILIDIANYESAVDGPIETTLGEAIQAEFPKAKVAKTLNCVSAHLMVDPRHLGGRHTVFVASNDEDAKRKVTGLLRDFGWESIVDLGDLTACRATEQLIPLWMRLYRDFGDAEFGIEVVRGGKG